MVFRLSDRLLTYESHQVRRWPLLVVTATPFDVYLDRGQDTTILGRASRHPRIASEMFLN